jgi:hypothetical protein
MVLASDYDALLAERDALQQQVESLQNKWAQRPLSVADTAALEAENDALRAALEKSRMPHLVVDGDCWYSCPKSGECCNDGEDKDHCNCGADQHNAVIDAALALVEGDKS